MRRTPPWRSVMSASLLALGDSRAEPLRRHSKCSSMATKGARASALQVLRAVPETTRPAAYARRSERCTRPSQEAQWLQLVRQRDAAAPSVEEDDDVRSGPLQQGAHPIRPSTSSPGSWRRLPGRAPQRCAARRDARTARRARRPRQQRRSPNALAGGALPGASPPLLGPLSCPRRSTTASFEVSPSLMVPRRLDGDLAAAGTRCHLHLRPAARPTRAGTPRAGSRRSPPTARLPSSRRRPRPRSRAWALRR